MAGFVTQILDGVIGEGAGQQFCSDVVKARGIVRTVLAVVVPFDQDGVSGGIRHSYVFQFGFDAVIVCVVYYAGFDFPDPLLTGKLTVLGGVMPQSAGKCGGYGVCRAVWIDEVYGNGNV